LTKRVFPTNNVFCSVIFADEEEKVELTKEILTYVAKAMAAHNKRLDDEKIKRALKPVFHERAEKMITTIFEKNISPVLPKVKPKVSCIRLSSVLTYFVIEVILFSDWRNDRQLHASCLKNQATKKVS
jgi:hypothetical protein